MEVIFNIVGGKWVSEPTTRERKAIIIDWFKGAGDNIFALQDGTLINRKYITVIEFV